ncbi:hypothetical protein TTHERM_000812601 (macronuclear) [Tetrahymena thermophila SB210]|uniref:Uncharacterized protein n=1 Tax=Tetrahymena thermophila (strain SB210) TaxID=312017 RepID=W7XA25_TETTS|nr:hypothetical protein TTHERM_000812601 [Tetrahymena thermophila SB210]EWS76250.1 hypothetical protein TTHERM_000812601 [Tetrahymena thermophila SB210]|eukprot:XP_012651209.1 hypothetical protein TTHERM_000812601 [Tetrahymena thermophila SB210]
MINCTQIIKQLNVQADKYLIQFHNSVCHAQTAAKIVLAPIKTRVQVVLRISIKVIQILLHVFKIAKLEKYKRITNIVLNVRLQDVLNVILSKTACSAVLIYTQIWKRMSVYQSQKFVNLNMILLKNLLHNNSAQIAAQALIIQIKRHRYANNQANVYKLTTVLHYSIKKFSNQAHFIKITTQLEQIYAILLQRIKIFRQSTSKYFKICQIFSLNIWLLDRKQNKRVLFWKNTEAAQLTILQKQ